MDFSLLKPSAGHYAGESKPFINPNVLKKKKNPMSRHKTRRGLK